MKDTLDSMGGTTGGSSTSGDIDAVITLIGTTDGAVTDSLFGKIKAQGDLIGGPTTSGTTLF